MTASNQPHRRGRPVVVPYSLPVWRRCSPAASVSSVGKGPSPTRVVYALMMAATRSMRVGGMPEPVHAPPEVADDENPHAWPRSCTATVCVRPGPTPIAEIREPDICSTAST